MTEKCSSSQQLFSPYCVLWIQKVGKIAKCPAMKLVADLRADMGRGRFNVLSLQGLLCPHLKQACNAEVQTVPEGLRQGPRGAKCRNTDEN